mmetsp:Transcript_23371/g.55323  ORF Transcript_23371/g.55323 Transcript_23371/m.55323 type:complete len:209 (+) Transcript_23371:904-1530(+)
MPSRRWSDPRRRWTGSPEGWCRRLRNTIPPAGGRTAPGGRSARCGTRPRPSTRTTPRRGSSRRRSRRRRRARRGPPSGPARAHTEGTDPIRTAGSRANCTRPAGTGCCSRERSNRMAWSWRSRSSRGATPCWGGPIHLRGSTRCGREVRCCCRCRCCSAALLWLRHRGRGCFRRWPSRRVPSPLRSRRSGTPNRTTRRSIARTRRTIS